MGIQIKKRDIYDTIFSLGEACSCTDVLRNSFLQFCSYPFDWINGPEFIERCKIVAAKFDRYINKEDLIFSQYVESTGMNVYLNKYNNVVFNHDFKATVPFDEMYEISKKKYDRRISRLLDNINSSKRVLMVYIETPTTNHKIVDDSEILEGYRIVKEAFSSDIEINLVYISNKKDIKTTKTLLNENILKINCDYKQYKSDIDYTVREEVLRKFFKNCKLKDSSNLVIKQKLIKFFINFVPIKSKRKELRRKFHVR